jgi:hypothetical protein
MTWAIIGSLKALQRLWVRISWPLLKFSAIEEKRMMEPMWMVTGWKGKDVDWSDAPFQVMRRTS